jgi:hypothetical protein
MMMEHHSFECHQLARSIPQRLTQIERRYQQD